MYLEFVMYHYNMSFYYIMNKNLVLNNPFFSTYFSLLFTISIANLVKLEFTAMVITGNNYMTWTIDLEMHFESMGLSHTIQEDNTATVQEKARAMIFLRKHLDESLKYEYICVKDPKDLWNDLIERFEHQREITLPNSRDEWSNLRF